MCKEIDQREKAVLDLPVGAAGSARGWRHLCEGAPGQAYRVGRRHHRGQRQCRRSAQVDGQGYRCSEAG